MDCLDNFAVLDAANGVTAYWITTAGHARIQPATGLQVGTFGVLRGGVFVPFV